MESRRQRVLLWGGLLAGLLGAYWNHFGNGFHFDDADTVVDNPAIRTIANIPSFFSDARTFSSIPTGQSYRPLVTASLAVDYWLGGGLKPFWFHLSTFIWLVIELVLVYALFKHVLDRARSSPQNAWIAWFAAALYGLHPVSAETVNYIVQRGDLYVALGIVAAVVIYAWKPAWRRYGLYLIPGLAAMFAKPTGIIFAPMLAIYIVVVDRPRSGKRRLFCALSSMPAFALSGAFICLEKVMTPPTFFATKIPSFDYWITQPYVALRYFRSFLLPLYLNIDTDLRAFQTLASVPVLAGFGFCALSVVAAILTSRRREWLPVSFGLWWFLIGLVPTALFPLNEVENDHRMFLPFVGLSLAVVGTCAILLRLHAVARIRRFAIAGAVVLAVCAFATYRRNEVWRTEETLWRDDIDKSPNNARGHNNLGHALWESGRASEAISEYEIALRLDPDYADAHNNLGLALTKVPGRLPDAIREYRAALRISPDLWEAHYNLGAALAQVPGRLPEAITEYQTALRTKPDYADVHTSLGIALSKIRERLPDAVAEFQAALSLQPEKAEAHSNFALALYMSGRIGEAISEFEAAYRIKPDPAVRQTLNILRAKGSAE